jgi:hypothetical protein
MDHSFGLSKLRIINNEDNEFSYIDSLPDEINSIILEYLVPSCIPCGIMEAKELLEVAEATHEYVVGEVQRPIPFDLEFYFNQWVDTRDPDDVDDELYTNSRRLMNVASLKMVVCWAILVYVPRVGAVSATDLVKQVDGLTWQFCLMALGALLALTIGIGLALFLGYLLKLSLSFIGRNVICKPVYWIYKRICVGWVSYKMGPIELENTVGEGVITEFVSNSEGSYYKVIIDGKTYKCKAYSDNMPYKPVGKQEMAQKNSSLNASEFKPVGVILSTDGRTSRVVGGFFRLGDYLITASHVIEAVLSCADDFVMASFVKDGNRCKLSNFMDLDKDAFDFSNNVIKYSELDCFAIRMDLKFWSYMGITRPKCAHSHFNQTVTAVGCRDGILVCSTGVTQEGDNVWTLKHKATTYPGFSGFPLFMGKGVVGLHTGHDGVINEMIRIETIAALLPVSKEEALYVYFDPLYEGSRSVTGALMRMANHFGYDIGVDAEGRCSFKKDDHSKYAGISVEDFEEDPDVFMDLPIGNVSKYIGYESGDYEFPSKTLSQIMMEEDDYDYQAETLIRPPEAKVAKKAVSKKKKKKRVKIAENGPITAIEPPGSFVVLPKLERMSVPKIREENAFMSTMLESKEGSLQKLGYDSSHFQWPNLTNVAETVSMEKHLELYHKRCLKVPDSIRKTELKRVNRLLYKFMESAKFLVPRGYKTKEALEGIIDSSIIKDSKSPGYPYAASGMANNKTAIAKHGGTPGFADLVLQQWDAKTILRVFNKGEPHSLKKIKNEMLRIIAGFPLHKTIKHVSIFRPFKEKISETWLETPVKFQYSPLVPGANKHICDWLGYDGAKWASDKSNWDFAMMERHFNYCTTLILDLAIKPDDMTTSEYDEWKNDVKNAIHEVKSAEYVTSDGSHYKAKLDGIMRSGWYLTIGCNSTAQLAHHIECCILVGMSDEEILGSKIVVGGDDVLQNALACGTKAYIKASESLGVDLEIEETSSFEGSEFFSARFYKDPRGIACKPLRFTKHIENLKRTTVGEEWSAIKSLMAEWVWDDDKFEFFYNLYVNCHRERPSEFPLKQLVNKDYLKQALNGDE